MSRCDNVFIVSLLLVTMTLTLPVFMLCMLLTCVVCVRTVLRALVGGSETGPRTDGSDEALKVDFEGGDAAGAAVGAVGEPPLSGAALLAQQRRLVSGGLYETVLVILQDLSASELEEAFDHIDVVTKLTDTAFVKLDGAS